MKLMFMVCGFLMMSAWTCGAFAATANGAFNFDFASDPVCSATVTADCIDHFEIWDVTSSPRKLSTVAMPTPAASPISFTFKVGPPYGSRKWSAVAVAKDGTTSDLAASQAQNTVNVRPGAPASFVVNLQ